MTNTLFAAESGEGDQTIVLLHGFAGHHSIWRDVQASLAKEFRTLAYDLPGHGKSLAFPGSGSAKAASIAILDDLAARGMKRAHVAGHSMGGAVAGLMAMAEPQRFGSVTFVAPGGFGEVINGALLERYAAAVSPDELRPCVAAMRGPNASIQEEELLDLSTLRGVVGQRAKLIELAGRLTRDGKQGMIPRDALAALPMPVAVVWGTRDNVLPVNQAAGLPPLFEVHIIPDAGHMLPEEHPELVARIITHNAG